MAARNVRVTDVLPLEFVENVVVDGGVLQGRATANFEEVPPGGAVGFAIEAVVRQDSDGTVVLNQATIVADDAEPVLTDDPATDAVDDATAFVVRAEPAVTLEMTVIDENGAPARPGEALT